MKLFLLFMMSGILFCGVFILTKDIIGSICISWAAWCFGVFLDELIKGDKNE